MFGPDAEAWIIVPRWNEFQHYRDRHPPWIRLYARLLHHPEYLQLSFAAKGLLTVIWLAYSEQNGMLSVRNLDRLCNKRLSYPQLIALNQAGFIEWSASKPLAAKAEAEAETEKKPPTPLPKQTTSGNELLRRAFDLAADWEGGPTERFNDALDALERELHAKLGPVHREKLWDTAYRRDRR